MSTTVFEWWHISCQLTGTSTIVDIFFCATDDDLTVYGLNCPGSFGAYPPSVQAWRESVFFGNGGPCFTGFGLVPACRIAPSDYPDAHLGECAQINAGETYGCWMITDANGKTIWIQTTIAYIGTIQSTYPTYTLHPYDPSTDGTANPCTDTVCWCVMTESTSKCLWIYDTLGVAQTQAGSGGTYRLYDLGTDGTPNPCTDSQCWCLTSDTQTKCIYYESTLAGLSGLMGTTAGKFRNYTPEIDGPASPCGDHCYAIECTDQPTQWVWTNGNTLIVTGQIPPSCTTREAGPGDLDVNGVDPCRRPQVTCNGHTAIVYCAGEGTGTSYIRYSNYGINYSNQKPPIPACACCKPQTQTKGILVQVLVDWIDNWASPIVYTTPGGTGPSGNIGQAADPPIIIFPQGGYELGPDDPIPGQLDCVTYSLDLGEFTKVYTQTIKTITQIGLGVGAINTTNVETVVSTYRFRRKIIANLNAGCVGKQDGSVDGRINVGVTFITCINAKIVRTGGLQGDSISYFPAQDEFNCPNFTTGEGPSPFAGSQETLSHYPAAIALPPYQLLDCTAWSIDAAHVYGGAFSARAIS